MLFPNHEIGIRLQQSVTASSTHGPLTFSVTHLLVANCCYLRVRFRPTVADLAPITIHLSVRINPPSVPVVWLPWVPDQNGQWASQVTQHLHAALHTHIDVAEARNVRVAQNSAVHKDAAVQFNDHTQRPAPRPARVSQVLCYFCHRHSEGTQGIN